MTISEAAAAAQCWGDGTKAGGGAKNAVAKSERPRVAAINCMALVEPRQVFDKIIEALGGVPPSQAETAGGGGGRSMGEVMNITQLAEVDFLRQIVQGTRDGRDGGRAGGGPPVVVLLDEMDSLVTKAQGILYELFGLPTLQGSRCVVVGVANSINLVEMTLPRLKARGCEPSVIRFFAYNKDQLKAMLTQRLSGLPKP
jgi:cell division control protein 6